MRFLFGNDLQVGYQKKIVVDNVNIDLNKGEILCLLGPNGCGKSTILKSITDHIKLIKGSISVMGKDINALNNRERAKHMSVVLTEKISPEMMTAYDVVAMGRYPHTRHFGRLSNNDLKVINESIEIVNGGALKDKEFKYLSDGQKQRIMIARAICQETDIMVLDEPTSFLDIRYKIELLNILRILSLKRKQTIIMSLHEIDLVSKIADKVLLIKDGEIYDYGTPEDIITDNAIKEVYDLGDGYFNTTIGNLELPKGNEKSKVFVIGGGGQATKLYRALHKKDIGFYSGILFKNDIDYNVSKVLGNGTIVEDDFMDIRTEKLKEAKAYIRDCRVLIDSGVSLAGINKSNYDLLRFASREGIEILSLRDECIGINVTKYKRISSVMERLKESDIAFDNS